jgi:mRNA interferase HicA
MNAKQLKRELTKLGCTFENHRGGSGHLTIYYRGKKSQISMHGGNKELGTNLVERIKKQLGLK